MDSPAPRKAAVAAAFAAVWLIWGSTYLAIAWVLEALPPFLMAGARFVVAGLVLLAWRRLRGEPLPVASEWRAAAITGCLMLVGGNGGVCWAEQWLPSGLVALIVASVPAWMVLFDWARRDGTKPSRATLAGLVLGFAGVALLVAPREGGHPLVGLVVVVGSACWALGSILARRGGLPRSPLMATGAQMLAGGAGLLLAGLLGGETSRVALDAVTPRAALSLGYLVVFGSLIAFSCYAWLLRVSTPSKVSTYAYVNPVVAVMLGTFAGEALHPRMLAAGALIVAGVAAITITRPRPPSGREVAARGVPGPHEPPGQPPRSAAFVPHVLKRESRTRQDLG